MSIASEIEQKGKNEARTAAVLEKLQAAINEKRPGPADGSENYSYADMIDRARNTFPEEDVYYKLLTTEEYVALIVTKKKNKMSALTGSVPVQGPIGEEGTEYKLRQFLWYRTQSSRMIFYIIIQGFFCLRHRNVKQV